MQDRGLEGGCYSGVHLWLFVVLFSFFFVDLDVAQEGTTQKKRACLSVIRLRSTVA